MALPDHVKRQAMDAVSQFQNTAQIRLVRDNGSAQPGFTQREPAQPTRSPIPDDVKKQAMDAVSQHKNMADLRLVKNDGPSDKGQVSPMATPQRSTMTDRINQMNQAQQSPDAIHTKATKEGFDMERYG